VEIKKFFNELEKAKSLADYKAHLKTFESLLNNDDANIVLLEKRAKFHEKFQQYGKAINDYKKIVKTDPENKHAKTQIELLKTILRYTNTDIYASTNTNMDPWLE